MTCHWRITLGIAWLTFVTATHSQTLNVTGFATHEKNGVVLYREQHDISREHHTVLYIDAQGKRIASKQLRYAHGFNTPEYLLQDMRNHRSSGSEWRDGHFVVFRQEDGKQRSEKIIVPDNSTVIDAGFDHFIRDNWTALVDGKTLPFALVVADPLTVLHMEAMEVSAAQTAIQQHDERYRYFIVRGSNPLIGWAIPALHLAYDRQSKLLQVYQGPSNIPDADGNTQTVNIRYSYAVQPPAGQTGGQ